MTNGYIYVFEALLKNPYMPSLVKIGYTNRSPSARAAELSNHTGSWSFFCGEKLAC